MPISSPLRNGAEQSQSSIRQTNLASLGVLVLKSRIVDRQCLVEQATQRLLDDRVQLRYLEREIVLVAPVALRRDIMLIKNAIDVLAALVLGEVLDEFAVNTNGAGDDGHDVLGKSPGLICADNASVRHSLARTEGADKEALLSHALGSEREGKSNSKR